MAHTRSLRTEETWLPPGAGRSEFPASLSSSDTFAMHVYRRHVRRHSMRFAKRAFRHVLLLLVCIAGPGRARAQDRSAPDAMTLQQCIDYALDHQPAINQSQLNISVAKTTNAIAVSGWLPQVNASGSLTHYNTLPTTFIANSTPGGPPVETHNGIVNTAVPVLSATQTIFDPQLLYAVNSAHLYVDQAKKYLDSARIGAVVQVSKSFYALLQTLAQVDVLKEDTARLGRNVKDTYHQYIGGIVDETDYQEAVISLNNSLAQLRQQVENVRPQYFVLKQAMGYPPDKQFNVVFDTVQMMQDIAFDTTAQLRYENRIEYQQLQTAKKIQHELTNYYGLAFLPTVSAFYNYYYEFENNSFSDLFSHAYPYSNMGITFSIPIFRGLSRLENIHRSRLQEQVIDWGEVNLRSVIYTEYNTALASYKYNFYNWTLLKENVTRAREVFRVVSLQYKYGVVAYLNMIVAESNLIQAEVGASNALFQLLASKIDLEKAMGNIPYKH